MYPVPISGWDWRWSLAMFSVPFSTSNSLDLVCSTCQESGEFNEPRSVQKHGILQHPAGCASRCRQDQSASRTRLAIDQPVRGSIMKHHSIHHGKRRAALRVSMPMDKSMADAWHTSTMQQRPGVERPSSTSRKRKRPTVSHSPCQGIPVAPGQGQASV